jgi:hypothetical protein
MIDDIKKEISALSEKGSKEENSANALRFTQAALNLANVAVTLVANKVVASSD